MNKLLIIFRGGISSKLSIYGMREKLISSSLRGCMRLNIILTLPLEGDCWHRSDIDDGDAIYPCGFHRRNKI